MKLHENKELFEEAILAASQLLNIPEIYIEKDYWVTLVLYEIFHSSMSSESVFKGGTALSKCHKLIERFSEDIDIVVVRNKGESDSQLTKKIRKISTIVKAILPEITIEGLTNKKGNIRKTVHQYNKIYNGSFGQVREHIILETSWLGNFEPYTTEKVSCYVTNMMENTEQNELIKKYSIAPFTIQVLSKERTLCEKIMSLVRFSLQGDPYVDLANKIRHIYDIHMLLKNEEVAVFFEKVSFDEMLIKVGKDDIVSYNSNNEWLRQHPAKAIIFDQPVETWDKIKTTYRTLFKELVIGELPAEADIVTTLRRVAKRLKTVAWNIC
ncbi:MAG: nucleotidyl transferase AbiEii/AbiGii toxin family protein [Spirochaetales bacterium]|nr:nucleotidyl transferase AbiEii/AbiGii toxin family protein [Spirochaetales bacterium]